MNIHTITAPMVGTVLEVNVTIGEEVKIGQEVALLESMKMEIPVEATASGTVLELLVQPGDVVEEGKDLLTLSVGG